MLFFASSARYTATRCHVHAQHYCPEVVGLSEELVEKTCALG
jgi:hypothetical protein